MTTTRIVVASSSAEAPPVGTIVTFKGVYRRRTLMEILLFQAPLKRFVITKVDEEIGQVSICDVEKAPVIHID